MRSWWKVTGVALLALAMAKTNGQLIKALQAHKACVCHQSYRPVCTTDGLTIPNACTALCRQKSILCHNRCPCQGQEDSNQDEEDESDAKPAPPPVAAVVAEEEEDDEDDIVISTDDIEDNCNCSTNFDPVCDTQGRTFRNPCSARCQSRRIACDQACPCPTSTSSRPITRPPAADFDAEEEDDTCFCNEIFRPVCGENGETYTNLCFARCKRVEAACHGRCPCLDD